MDQRKLKNLIAALSPLETHGKGNPDITSLAYDSRDVEPGSLFFALPGVHVDGHDFIEQALDSGAAAIIHSAPLPSYRPEVPYIRVEDSRRALSPVSAEFWGHPSKEMTVIGVTGTDGKSTTVSLIRQLLEMENIPTGQLSTVSFTVGHQSADNPLRQSTPEAPQVHGLLRAMKDAGQDYAVIEATSHGLSPRNSRLADVDFDAAVITNVTSEHLEFHGSLEAYRNDKAELFRMIARSPNDDAFGVVNQDDPHHELFWDAAGEKAIYTYSVNSDEADVYATDIKANPGGTSFVLHTPLGEVKTRLNIPNPVNVENALAALCVVSELQAEYPRDLAERLPKLEGVKGRMEPIRGDMPFNVLVDYAHSPGSFRRLLPFLKTLSEGRLILVFGSAGERDLEKRPEQGALASEYADLVILADEDPRGEDSMAILEDIAKGCAGLERDESLLLIPDRREALKEAMVRAREGDLVVALGKGHETSIIYADGKRPWDEAGICREVLDELGWELDS